MVDSETIETKISDKKEEFEEEVEDETFDDEDDLKTKYEERKEKGKNIADNVLNDLYASIDDFKEYIKNVQKNADQKYADYKKATVQSLDVDLSIETTFKSYIEEFEEDETAEVISSSLKSGRCVKTIRFENSIDLENITAKFANGTVLVTIPKLIIPKHKVNVE